MSDEEMAADKESSGIREELDDEEEYPENPLACDIDGRDNNSMRKLENFLDLLSRKPSRDFEVSITKVDINRPWMIRLLPLLLHNETSPASFHDHRGKKTDYDVHSLGSATKNDTKVGQCNMFQLKDCRFFSQSDVTLLDHDDDVCTPDDKFRFLAALARHVRNLEFCWSDTILSEFLSTAEIHHVEANRLLIHQDGADLEFTRLGAMIQNSIQLTHIDLAMPLLDGQREFYDSLANSIHIQSVRLDDTDWEMPNEIIGEDGSALERLLRNPQNQLTELHLTFLGTHQVVTLAQLLTTSKVETIHIFSLFVRSYGFVEFARRIPQMHSLTKLVFLADFHWQEECGAALLHGLMENPSVTHVQDVDKFPQAPLLRYHLSLNRTLRKLLSSSRHHNPEENAIPHGLWAHIMGRVDMFHDDTENCLPNGPADAMYYLLQNHYPAIFSCWKS